MSKKKLIGLIAFFLIIHQVFALVYFLFGGFIAGLLGFIDLTGESGFDSFIQSQAATATFVAGAASLGLYAFIYRKEEPISFYRLKLPSAKIALISFVLGVSAVYMSGYLIFVVDFFFPEAVANYIETFEDFTLGNPFFAFLAIVIMAPLFEEVLFRGVLFRLFERSRVKLLTTMILTSLLFGAFHLNIVQGTFASVLGFVIALAYVWTGTLWVPIIIHFGNNLWAYLNGVEPIMDFFANNETFSAIVSLVAVLVIIPGTLYLLYKDRTPIDYSPEDYAAPKPQEIVNDPFA